MVRGQDLVGAALAQLDETIRRTGAHIQVATDFPSYRVNKTWVTASTLQSDCERAEISPAWASP